MLTSPNSGASSMLHSGTDLGLRSCPLQDLQARLMPPKWGMLAQGLQVTIRGRQLTHVTPQGRRPSAYLMVVKQNMA